MAIKSFKIDQNNENSLKDFLSECHAMEALRHPNIVMFLGISSTIICSHHPPTQPRTHPIDIYKKYKQLTKYASAKT